MASSTMRIMALGVAFTGAWGVTATGLRGEEEGRVDAASRATRAAGASDVAPRDPARADDAFDRMRMVRELMKRRGGEPAAAAQLVQLVREFPPSDAFAAFDALAGAHERAGQLNLAAEARLMAVQAYPQEPAARAALLWLTRLYASSEVAHRQRPTGQAVDPEADRGAAVYAYQLATSVPAPMSGSGKRGDESSLVFARAVAARRAGIPKAAGTLLATLKHAKGGNPWGDCARVEDWLESGGVGEAPKTVVRCVHAVEAPRLDGVLDEACWVGGATRELHEVEAEDFESQAAGTTRAADVRWAWDGEYLYVAVRCVKGVGMAYPRDARGRTRDAALEAFDRVRLLVDVDRDYATCFELTIDSRGWTRDACWGDGAWNPEWFVAAGETDEEWTAEAAIGLEQLGANGVTSGAAWGVGAERWLPGGRKGEGAKSRGAYEREAPGPEGFGVLLFE